MTPSIAATSKPRSRRACSDAVWVLVLLLAVSLSAPAEAQHEVPDGEVPTPASATEPVEPSDEFEGPDEFEDVDLLDGLSVQVDDVPSQDKYGLFDTSVDTLISGSTAALALANLLLDRYKEPNYRIDSAAFNVEGLDSSGKNKILSY